MKSDKLLQLVANPAAQNKDNGKASDEPKAPRSPKQIETSRQNGAKSQGPTSAAGKFHSSQSALRHGLSATKFTLLANEDPAQYSELIQAFITDFQPATKTELRLVEKLANLDWRMERFALIETCLLNMAVTEHYDEIDAAFNNLDDGVAWIVTAWRKSHDLPACLTLLARYMGTLQHQYNSTAANFYKMEKRRRDRRHDPDLDPDYNPPYKQPEFDTLNKEPDGTAVADTEDEVEAGKQTEASTKLVNSESIVKQNEPENPPSPSSPLPPAS